MEIANTIMPFGKYKGRRLIDLPGIHLCGQTTADTPPAGKLGELMQITLLIKTEGLT
ncbi:putative quorum-sensing-regulated virulence factor, partial [Escherichia coli]|uniref:putative quorum-sensing-regulated virulence factor n=1 Tax=Escherichia coli TaxID=562 RepID=UPI003D35A760